MRLPVLTVTLAMTAAAMACGPKGDSIAPPSSADPPAQPPSGEPLVPGVGPPASGDVIQWGTSTSDLASGVGVAPDGHVWVGGWQADGVHPTNQLAMRRFTASGEVDLDEVLPANGWHGFAFSTALGTPFMTGLAADGTGVEIAFDSTGAVRWRAELPDTPDYAIGGLAATADGTTYVGLASYGPAGRVALSKVGADGTVLWTRDVTGDTEPQVVADGTRVYTASHLAVELAADGQASRFGVVVTRLTPAGDVVWTRHLDDPTASVEVTALAVTADGGVIAAAFTLPPSSSPQADRHDPTDPVVVRWDADGNILWTTTIASATNAGTGVAAIAIATDGSVAVVGRTSGLVGQASHGALDDDAFVAKLDAAGAIRWTRVFGTPASESATGVAFDTASNVYVCGITFGAFAGSVSAGITDEFLARLTPDGEFQ